MLRSHRASRGTVPVPERSLPLQLNLDPEHPEFLHGLDLLLQLGLIGDAQVRRIARDRLTCPCPEPLPLPPGDFSSDFADELPVPAPPSPAPARPTRPQPPSPQRPAASGATRWWQSFQAELSVRWLLFLGVFLIVASASIPAASHWPRFSPLAQYGVLWAYTSVFALIGFAAQRLPNLRLTGQSLQLVALLLLPINAWAIDGLGLFEQLSAWPAIALAAASFIAFAWSQRPQWSGAVLAAFAASSALHGGWSLPGLPLYAVYLSVLLGVPFLHWHGQRCGRAAAPGFGLLLYAIALLFGRALAAGLPLEMLGFPLGALGGLLAVPRPQLQLSADWQRLLLLAGGGLLALGWAVTVRAHPGQTAGISLLAVVLLGQRLRLAGRWWDLLLLFFVGGQGCVQGARLLPEGIWQVAVAALATRLDEAIAAPALGITLLFLYNATFLGGMTWLYRRQQARLAFGGEGLAIASGALLALGSTWHPALLLWACSLETLLLFAVATRRPRRLTVYLTHASTLLTLGAGLARLRPDAEGTTWAIALTAAALAQWLLPLVWGDRALSLRWDSLRQSGWVFGLACAALSYHLWLAAAGPLLGWNESPLAALSWLSAPLALSLLASRYQRSVNATLSTSGLVIGQLLVAGSLAPRLIGLGLATALMGLNTHWLRWRVAALLNVAFALAWLAAAGWPFWDRDGWLLAGALAIATLLASNRLLQRCAAPLAQLYQQATGIGAIATSLLWGLAAIAQVSASYQGLWPATPAQPLAAAMVAAAWLLGGRWAQAGAIAAIAIALELLAASSIALAGGTHLLLAAANIGAALAWLLLADGLLGWRWAQLRSPAWARLFLILAAFGWALRWGEFHSYTGLLTLGAALVMLGSHRRRPGWRWLGYLGLAGLTAGWYELAAYPLSQAAGGNPADGWTILAWVGLAIALVDRSLAALWRQQGIVPLVALRPSELRAAAHLHWAIAALCLLFGRFQTGPEPLQLAWAALLGWGLLALYALGQARSPRLAAEAWVYLGLASAAGGAIYARWVWQWIALERGWWLFAGTVALLCELSPWARWGWPLLPWRRAAVVLPLLAILFAPGGARTLDLLFLAAVYGAIAASRRQGRWSYVSLLLVNWALGRWLLEQAWLESASVYGFLFGFSLLYAVQVEPPQRARRHAWRLAGSAAIALTSLAFYSETGLLPLALGALAIALGIALRIRAPLFAGTATFLLEAAYQLVILSADSALLKGLLGSLAGGALIAIAANFERRAQFSLAWQAWLAQWRDWA